MGLEYAIDVPRTHARIVGHGALRMPEMIAAVDALAEDPAFQARFSVILDLRDATYTAELPDGDAFVSVLKRRLNDFQGPFALVVPPDLHFLARLYSVLAKVGGFDHMDCFTDISEARRWCGLDA